LDWGNFTITLIPDIEKKTVASKSKKGNVRKSSEKSKIMDEKPIYTS